MWVYNHQELTKGMRSSWIFQWKIMSFHHFSSKSHGRLVSNARWSFWRRESRPWEECNKNTIKIPSVPRAFLLVFCSSESSMRSKQNISRGSLPTTPPKFNIAPWKGTIPNGKYSSNHHFFRGELSIFRGGSTIELTSITTSFLFIVPVSPPLRSFENPHAAKLTKIGTFQLQGPSFCSWQDPSP